MTKKRVRSFLSLILVFAMVLSLAPSSLTVKAAPEDFTIQLMVENSGNYTASGGAVKVLTIPAKDDVYVSINIPEEKYIDWEKTKDLEIKDVDGHDGIRTINAWNPGDYKIFCTDGQEILIHVYGLMVYDDIEDKWIEGEEDEEGYYKYNVVAGRDDDGKPLGYLDIDNIAGTTYFGYGETHTDWQSGDRFFAYRDKNLKVSVVKASDLKVGKWDESSGINPGDMKIAAKEDAPDFVTLSSDKVGEYKLTFASGEAEGLSSSIKYCVNYPTMRVYSNEKCEQMTDDWHNLKYKKGMSTYYTKIESETGETIKDIRFSGRNHNQECDFSGSVSGDGTIIPDDECDVPFTISNVKASGDCIMGFTIKVNEGVEDNFNVEFKCTCSYDNKNVKPNEEGYREDDNNYYLTNLEFQFIYSGLVVCNPFEWDSHYDDKLEKEVLDRVDCRDNYREDYSKNERFAWWDYELVQFGFADDKGDIEDIELTKAELDKFKIYKGDQKADSDEISLELVEFDGHNYFNIVATRKGSYTFKYDNDSSVTIDIESFGMELFFKNELAKENMFDQAGRFSYQDDAAYRKLYLKAGADVKEVKTITIETAKKRSVWENGNFVRMREIKEREFYANDNNLKPTYKKIAGTNDYEITIPETFKGDFILHAYGEYIDENNNVHLFGQDNHEEEGIEIFDHWFGGKGSEMDSYSDDKDDTQLGFSGCFIPTLDFKHGGGFLWDDYPMVDPVYWVHAETAQGVIDKLAAVAKNGGKVKAWVIPEPGSDEEIILKDIEISDCKYITIQPAPAKTGPSVEAAKKLQTINIPDGIEGICLNTTIYDNETPDDPNDDILYDFPETKLVSYHDIMLVINGTNEVSTEAAKVSLGFTVDSTVKYDIYKNVVLEETDDEGNPIVRIEKKASLGCGFAKQSYSNGFGTTELSSYYIDPTGIKIATNPTKLVYTEGETFDGTGMVISYTYANGLTGGKFTKDYTVSNTNPLTVNDKSVKITYKGFEAEVAITVNPKSAPASDQGQTQGTTPTPAPAPAAQDVGTTVETGADVNGSFTVIDKGTGENSEPEVAYTKPDKSEAKVVIPSTIKDANGVEYKVTVIDANAFKNDKKLTKVTIPATVETIGKNAFAGCKKLTTVTLGNGVETIGQNAFANCTNLKKVTVTKSVTVIGKGAFNGCKKLKTITITSTKVTKIEKNAFKGIDKKATIKVPKKMLKQYKKLLKKAGFKGAVKGK